ncbi:HNH endonuclease [Pigmentibacter ruber]|uniref:HNH endonuclease n=1 Tax=Pigmentibacter ruber TaxID=2683196 RepID=UPI00131C51D1|nr:HNH endonuclease [Pigmentibacter ruber]
MNCWWVNQNKTFNIEVNRGFLWSPQKNNIGKSHISYENMKKVEVGDTIFSNQNSLIKAIGIVTNKAIDCEKPNYEKSSENWKKKGWLIKVEFNKLDKFIEVKNLFAEIKSNLKNTPFTKNGLVKQGYLFELDFDLAYKILEKIYNPYVDQINLEKNGNSIGGEKLILTYQRIGQKLFKKNLQIHEKKCRITGTTDIKHLIASHIKPWRESSSKEKICEYNGLLLTPHIDHLFDKGYISFSNDGNILISKNIDELMLKSWGIDINKNVGLFKQEQIKYLEYHRKKFNFD